MLTPSTALTMPSNVLHTPASSICPGPISMGASSQRRGADGAPPLDERNGAETGADDGKRDDGRDGAERVEGRRRDVERHAPDFERQCVERSGGLECAGKFIVGERE